MIPIDKLFAGHNGFLVYAPKPGSDSVQSDDPFEQALTNPVVLSLKQRSPGPDEPKWKIPPAEWASVVRRVVENREPLRKVAEDYDVSYETVRRVVRATATD